MISVVRQKGSFKSVVSLIKTNQYAALLSGTRNLTTSRIQRTGASPIGLPDPLPPPEFEADGTPRKYPLFEAIQDHGYSWEHWTLTTQGVFHTAYWGDIAQDYSPFAAWIQSIPFWVGAPILVTTITVFLTLGQKTGNVGIKPKRYTIEWLQATKERERVENTNPVTRFLDRRCRERGWHMQWSDYMPYHGYFMWMHNSHDHEWREERGLKDLREGGPWTYKVEGDAAAEDE